MFFGKDLIASPTSTDLLGHFSSIVERAGRRNSLNRLGSYGDRLDDTPVFCRVRVTKLGSVVVGLEL